MQTAPPHVRRTLRPSPDARPTHAQHSYSYDAARSGNLLATSLAGRLQAAAVRLRAPKQGAERSGMRVRPEASCALTCTKTCSLLLCAASYYRTGTCQYVQRTWLRAYPAKLIGSLPGLRSCGLSWDGGAVQGGMTGSQERKDGFGDATYGQRSGVLWFS